MSTLRRVLVPAALLVAIALLPFVPVSIPGLFEGPLDSPGTLDLLGLCFVFGALAVTYDLAFGYTGLLSFGHALYFASGAYATAIALERWHWSLPLALAFTAVVGVLLPLALGAICLRVRDIPFAMVTLAFAEAASILVLQNPYGLTGGEEGIALSSDALPATLVGVSNTAHLYWLAAAVLAIVCGIAYWAVNSSPGRVWQAVRENERRVSVLGLDPYTYKLGAFTLSGFLATLAGVAYLFLQGGANPQITTSGFTLVLLVMVVLGGVGTLWGALIGGIVYEYLDFRLLELSNAPSLQSLPPVFRVPLSEPLFVLGTLFVVLVLFVPEGLGGLLTARSRLRRR